MSLNKYEPKIPGWYWTMHKYIGPRWTPVEVRFISIKQSGLPESQRPEFWDPIKMKWFPLLPNSQWYGPIEMPK